MFHNLLFLFLQSKLIEAIDCSGHNEIAFLILKFYDEYVSEVRKHLELENTKVFPYIDELIKGHIDEQVAIEMTLLHQEPIEQKLSELKNIIIKYYTPTNNGNLLNTVLFDIFICEEDLYTHYRMEELLFLPAVHLLEENKINEDSTSDDNEEEDDTDILSDREKDIIIGVVKGLTNKEIADQLFISLNTVTTHRRNIARKLNIHSPAGLTIYAIVNNLVDISEVKSN